MPKLKQFKCKACGTQDRGRFTTGNKSKCMKCLAIQEKERRKKKKNKKSKEPKSEPKMSLQEQKEYANDFSFIRKTRNDIRSELYG